MTDSQYRTYFQQRQVVADYLDQYEKVGSADAVVWQRQAPYLSRLIAARGASSGLDYACGGGRILIAYPESVADLHGWDSSDAMLERAAVAVPRARLRRVDLTEGLPADRFDLVTAFRLLLNVEAHLRPLLLGRLAGLLKPGGLLIVDNHGNRRSLRHPAVRLRGRRHQFANELSHADMLALFAGAGLRVVEATGWGRLPDPAYRTIGPVARVVEGWLLDRTSTPAGAIRVMYAVERA